MKSVSIIAAAAAIAFALGGCASQEPAAEKAEKPMAKEKMAEKAAAPKFMTADEVAKAFAKGSIVCKWKAGKKGSDKGTDYYYKDISATSGNADRVIADVTFPGKWSISGDTLSLQFGVVGEPQQYKLVRVDKKSYTAYLNGKKKKMTFTC